MSIVAPLPAIRYDTTRFADLSRVLAPPYDVLSETDKGALLARDPHNFVAIDLPHVPPKEAGPQSEYDAAARQMRAWLDGKILISDDQPSIYPYHQRYTYGGQTYVRKMFFARLRLEPFGQGMVFPHEQTFGGPKEDRLMLMKATAANLSPIFGLYPDVDNAISRRLEAAVSEAPVGRGTLDGVENSLWKISSPEVISEIARWMSDKPVFIADGHHRYGTALMYRDWVRERQRDLSPEHAANYVLCVFCAMEDAGCLILPTHRVLAGVQVHSRLAADPEIESVALEAPNASAALAELPRYGPQAIALCESGRYTMIRPRRPELLDATEKAHSPAWRRLALAFLHAHVLPRLASASGGKSAEIAYIKSAEEAAAQAESTRGSAFMMQATTMNELRDVCAAGDLMPQKSTFFYPKLASGLVVSSLA